jgi:hypothetical protein
MKLWKNALMTAVAGAIVFAACTGEAASYTLANAKQLGFGHIRMPDNIAGDEYIVKPLYFTLKKGARRLKDIGVDYAGKNTEKNDLLVEVYIDKYSLDSYWREPTAVAVDKQVWSESRKWKDDKGKEQTMTTTRYESEIRDCPGGYGFIAHVNCVINLVDARTGEILLQEYGNESNDKEIDAYSDIVKSFYKKVNKELKESRKLTK